MNSEEQSLIDGLFTRLRDAEAQTAPRDAQAEAQINRHLVQQPAAPYYMAQAMLIQEAAIKRLDQRVKELEAQAQQSRPSSGGFLAGLFGGGQSQEPRPAQAQRRPDGWGQTRFSQPGGAQANYAGNPAASNPNDWRPAQAPAAAQAAPQGGGFLRGALQTAAGVAGGVMVANALTSLFHSSQPQEIVEVIQEQPVQPEPSNFDDSSLQEGDRYADSGFSDTNYDDGGGFSDDSSFFGDDDGDLFS